MAQTYELMYILVPNLGDEALQEQISKYRTMLEELGAENIEIKQLGKKRLAYIIQKNRDKHTDGYYVQVNYSGDGKQVAPVERAMRLSEEVLRYLTIKLEQVKEQPEEEEEELAEAAS